MNTLLEFQRRVAGAVMSPLKASVSRGGQCSWSSRTIG